MSLDLKLFQRELAQQKVYDTWQYVNSLSEMLTYMDASYELLGHVYDNRKQTLVTKEQNILQTAIQTGSASVIEEDLHCTDVNIAGLIIDDGIFLRKTTIEFFHYARMSMDILFQIINAALFGDKASEVTSRRLVQNVILTLGSTPTFATLNTLLENNKNNDTFKYLQAFDNYIKHIKTILVTVKNSFIIGNSNEFLIREFVYDGKLYSGENALDKVRAVNAYVKDTVEKILTEIQKQLPNCLDNSQRIHKLNFKQIVKNKPDSNVVDYISFFIDVENDISELPSEIKVLPLIINPNDEIFSFDFRFHRIFIKKQGCEEDGIVGYAELKNGLDTNELYRVFKVKPCGIEEYHRYVFSFAQCYKKISINYYAMEGSVVFL